MDPVKEAFQKIKEDIFLLRNQIEELRAELSSLKTTNNAAITNTSIQSIPQPTNQQTNKPTPILPLPPQNQGLESLKYPNLPISIGNRGVPTNQQTNKPTNQQTNTSPQNSSNFDDFEKAREVLESLDTIKREIRLKFKRLTPQEMLVFSSLYSLEEQGLPEITYKIIAQNLNLSESSIRDYINKLLSKGVPILKIKRNNKNIHLKISPELKKIATLSTIMKLREI